MQNIIHLISQQPALALTLFFIGLAGGLCICGIVIVITQQRFALIQNQLFESQNALTLMRPQLQNAQQALHQKELSFMQLHTQQQERQRAHQQQLQNMTQQKEHITQEFEYIAQKVLSNSHKQQSEQQEQSIKLLLAPFQDKITHFGQQVQQFQHAQVSSHASLNNELQNIKALNQAITQEAKNLTRALKGDKKLTGSWGELQLERSLQAAGLQKDTHYLREASYQNQEGQNRRPDFIINLPDSKHIVIDSKMSLVAFEAAISAKTVEEQKIALSQHIQALKKHINDLHQKNYNALPGLHSPDFVLMYLAAEPALTEAFKFDAQLYDYASNKNIILVSQTTLVPIIKTIGNLWLRDRNHKQAFELAEKAGEIYQQLCTLAERLHKLGRTLQTAGNHYNDTVTALAGKQGLQGKVERFGELAKGYKPIATPHIQQDIDHHRLEPLIKD